MISRGFPQNLQLVASCVKEERPTTDGRAVLEAIFAVYERARMGRKVTLPFTPPEAATKPIDCWKPELAGRA